MSKSPKLAAATASNIFQFTLSGLLLFSLTLIGSAAFITHLVGEKPRRSLESSFAVNPNDKSQTVHAGPWGDLVVRNIQLERPAEYLNDEVKAPEPETWTFAGQTTESVKTLLLQGGLTADQAANAMAQARLAGTKRIVLMPSAAFLTGLDAPVRSKLYRSLAGHGVNLYVDYPYIFPGNSLESIYASPRLPSDDVALLKTLVYANGSARQLSDYQLLLCQIPTYERRVALAQVLSRQSAVLAALSIKPDTDIDKIAAYWGSVPYVRFTDIRPLLESLKALPEGGTLSLFYLLPKFARDRLYTFPLPPQAGEPTMDCHWTTFNFSNETPNNRFNDATYAVQYIRQNFYQIAAPSQYGDILLLMNDQQEIKHSAVFLADDLVFTKNGNNYRQPWMIMHIPDLLATYPADPPMHAVYLRGKQN